MTRFTVASALVLPAQKLSTLRETHSSSQYSLLEIETGEASFRIDRLREYLAKNY
jgi:hypothetical protein